MKRELFSIVIPVYNCEKYLNKCIDSVLNQTFENFEVLLIDDGSTDRSRKICDEYLKKDKRIKVIHQKNSGVSSARNVGIDMAKGKYLSFLDSDDYVDEYWLETSIKYLNNYDIELLNYGFISEVSNDEKNDMTEVYTVEKYYSSKEMIKEDLVYLWDKHMLYNIWNKIYLTEIIRKNDLKFPNYNFAEDMYFNMEYLKHVNKFCNSSACFYHYIKERKESLTQKFNEKLFEIRVKEFYEFNEYFENNGFLREEYIEFSSRRFIERVLGCVENVCACNMKRQNKKGKIKMMINNKTVRYTLKKAKPHSIKVRVMLVPLRLKNVTLTCFMGEIISFIRKSNPSLFNSLKNRR